ncbi:nucleoside hydrolase [Alteromonas sp. H39]|uniref:nucleoside hydrolase n=1 Tax=Alteromonas sp. H39 TaxID=3389876 RepID=UPI0039E04156
MTVSVTRRRVIFDHDGGIDDLLSLLLLLRMPNIDLVGVCITPADCYPDDALTSTLKILTLCGKNDIPVVVGNKTGPNPFPPDWRAQPRICHSLPAMLRVQETQSNHSGVPAHQFIRDILQHSDTPLTVLMTGPATNLMWALHDHPVLFDKVEEVVWMGGAIDVKGNVAMHDHDGSAEWNAYWDPAATAWLLASGLSVCLVPLDATNALPVNRDFLCELAACNTPVSDLAGQFWAATVTAIPTYEFTYFMWDILSTSILGLPTHAYERETGTLSASTSAPQAGRVYRDPQGGEVSWVASVQAQEARRFVLQHLCGEF